MSDTLLDRDTTSPFLTVPELAQLLHVNEKKIYQLANQGDIPGTKITGKWIFPKTLIEDWVIENSHGGVLSDRLILVGSDDLLLSQICNNVALTIQQSALLSYSPCGTRHGLRMLDSRRADACFINWGAHEENARRHLGLLRGYRNAKEWVVLRCLQRTQGLIIANEFANELKDSRQALMNESLRWARRNEDSASERLLMDLQSESRKAPEQAATQLVYKNERSAAMAVNAGKADITFGTQSTAHEYQLPFIPTSEVSIDLVMSRKTYFRSMVQQLLKCFNDDYAQQTAIDLRGYTLLPEQKVFTLS